MFSACHFICKCKYVNVIKLLLKRTSFRWDTAGQERFKCIAQSYYRSAHGTFHFINLQEKQYNSYTDQQSINFKK